LDYIYLIESYSEYESTYKIGFTKHKDPIIRLKQLKTGNHSELSVVYLFPTKHKRKIESSLHRQYSGKRISGEWFRLEDDDIINFEKRCKVLEQSFDYIEENKI
jgi:hypothetical protein